jgi:hypothetical protein
MSAEKNFSARSASSAFKRRFSQALQANRQDRAARALIS